MSYDTLFQKQIYSIKAKSMLTVNFPSFNPNYFRVVNLGSGEIYFSTSTSPTPNRFDMKVQPQGSKMHVEPYGKTSVYFYNDGAHDCDFILLAFNADFNPVALAVLSDESLADVIGEQEGYDGIIRGFNIPLPSGANTIGKVDLNSNSQLTAIKNAVDAVKTAVAGNLKLSTNTQLTDIKTAVDGVKSAVENISIPSGGGTSSTSGSSLWTADNITACLANIEYLKRDKHRFTIFNSKVSQSGGNAAQQTIVKGTISYKICSINFLTNDGENTIKLTINGDKHMLVKSGETLNHIPVDGESVTITDSTGNASTSVSYRAAFEYRESAE